ncbi:MAG TPA: hypothetical protein VHW00_01295 [Thermoanaerobaculia bacterium]|nr:hypothetical protein [Thermoanaerobaculia bacterium]
MKPAYILLALLVAAEAAAQHDITQVEPVAPDTAISTPIPDRQQKRLKSYEVPELAGAKQVIGPQLIDGRLRKPMIDFLTIEGRVEQRISIFEGGLVVVKMTGATGIRKKVLLPDDGLKAYTRTATTKNLRSIDQGWLPKPDAERRALLRVYDADGTFVERVFHPNRVLSKQLTDQIEPLRDLLRVISEDRGVTTSIANYEPKAGDQLVADDHKVWTVARVVEGVVELHCDDAPTAVFIASKDLHLYFMGAKAK